jgi:hypothetical protein
MLWRIVHQVRCWILTAVVFTGHVNVAPRHLTAEAESLFSATLIHEVLALFLAMTLLPEECIGVSDIVCLRYFVTSCQGSSGVIFLPRLWLISITGSRILAMILYNL